MITTKFWEGVGFVSLAIMVISGCSGGESSASATAGAASTGGGGSAAGLKKKIKITMIAKSNNNPVFQSARKGAEDAAAEFKKEGIDVTIDWETPDAEDAQVQAQRIQQGVNNGADAILLSCTDASKVNGAINDAVDKGVPVMTFDSDAPDSKRFAFYGANDEAAGKQVMDELAASANGQPLTVAILAGTETAPNLQKRSKAVIEEAKKFPNIKILDTYHHKESPQDATAEVQKDDNAHPEINAWAMVGGWPLFNTALLSLDPGKYKIVAIDALPDELPYVEKGIAPVLLAQPTYEWGHKSVGIIVDKLAKGKNVDTINTMALVKVDKDTLGDWARQLKAWGFEKIDPKYLTLPAAKK